MTSMTESPAIKNPAMASPAKLRLLIAFSTIVILVFHISLFSAMQRFQKRKPDFASLYQGGRAIIHERFPGLVTRFPALNSDDYTVLTSAGEFPSDTMHPPYEMAIYATLALFKYRIAVPLWWISNLLFLMLTARILWKHVPNLREKSPYLVILIGTFFPLLVALVQGQNSLLLLVLLTLCYDSLASQHDFRAGFILAMGMFKFVLVIPMVLLLAIEKRWRSLAGFATGCFGLLLLACSLVGTGGVVAYVQRLAGYGKAAPEQAGTESLMPNLRGLIHTLGAAIAPGLVLTVLTLTLTLVLVIWVDGRILKCPDLSLRFSSQVLLALLVSYHLYPHDAAVLILPLAILLNHVLNSDVGAKYRRTVVLCVACIYLLPLVAGLKVGMTAIGIATLVLLALEQTEFTPNRVRVAVQ